MDIPLSSITVPPRRQRTGMDATKLADLKASIRNLGLLHPIVVRPLPVDPGADPVFQLICGERRFTAFKELADDPLEGEKWTTIPATLIAGLSRVQRMEAELEENLLREDLSWQDRTKAIADLHTLRQTQKDEFDERHPDDEAAPWTITDTAREIAKVEERPIDGVRAEVTRALVVAKAMQEGSAVVANARSQREAYDLISRQTEREFTAALRKVTGGKTDHTFLRGDMRELEWPTMLDCVIADLPYGIGADSFGNAGASHEYDDTLENALRLYEFVAAKSFAYTKPSAHIYLFCDILLFVRIREILAAAGWDTFRTPVIWYKGSQGFDPKPGIGFRRTYEAIAFAWKGKRPAKSLVNDVLAGERHSGLPAPQNSGHAAAKPVELYRTLLARSCNPADRVLDPCCGSGPIFPAATALGLNAWGFEISEEYAKLAEGRLTSKV